MGTVIPIRRKSFNKVMSAYTNAVNLGAQLLLMSTPDERTATIHYQAMNLVSLIEQQLKEAIKEMGNAETKASREAGDE